MNSILNSPTSAAHLSFVRFAMSSNAAPMPETDTPKNEFSEFRAALEATLHGFEQSVIGITGIFGGEKTQSLARVLAQSVSLSHSLTTTYVNITRSDIMEVPAASDADSWGRIELRKNRFNAWPNKPVTGSTRYQIDSMQLLRWLRRNSEFSVVAFDTLEQVIDRSALARRLEGLVIVNSGRSFELDVMAAARDVLLDRGVRLLGQVRRIGSAPDHQAT